MRAQAEGRAPTYTLDEPVDVKGPQFQAVLKNIDNPDGKWPEVKFEQTLTGQVASGPFRKKGSKGVWDWESNGNNAVVADVLSGKMTVQEALDLAQMNWDESFEGLPTG